LFCSYESCDPPWYGTSVRGSYCLPAQCCVISAEM
jgi:hypothetical protein